jgi:hypothetical protein
VGTPSGTRVVEEPLTEEVTDPSAALATAPSWFAPLPLQEPQPVTHSTLRWGHAQDAHASGATRPRTCTRSRRWSGCHRWHAPKTPTPRGKGHAPERQERPRPEHVNGYASLAGINDNMIGNSPIPFPPKPYLSWDTLCSCEAYGMKPMCKEKEENWMREPPRD